jgi:hypothetical protein
MLTTLTATAEANPIAGFQFFEMPYKFRMCIHFYERRQFGTGA